MPETSVVAILGAVGTFIASILAAYARAQKTMDEFDVKHATLQVQLRHAESDIIDLRKDRLGMQKMLEGQTRALTNQSERLTATINALAAMTLDRDDLAQKVRTLTEENAMLRNEIEVFKRQLAGLRDSDNDRAVIV